MSSPIIVRVEERSPGLFFLALREPSVVGLVVLCLSGEDARVFRVHERPMGDGQAANEWMRGLREKLVGAQLDSLRMGKGKVQLSARYADHAWLLSFDHAGPRVDDALGAVQPHALHELRLSDVPSGAMDEIVELHRQMLLRVEHRFATKQLLRFRHKLSARLDALGRDCEHACRASEDAERAKAFVAVAARAARGTLALTTTLYTESGPQQATMRFLPDSHPREQVEAVFAKAKRLNKGAQIRESRITEARRSLEEVDFSLLQLDEAQSVEAIRLAFDAAVRSLPAGVRPAQPTSLSGRARRSEQTRVSFRRYLSLDGYRLLVGRDAGGNDELVTRVARPHDVWLHARGCRGAHVILVAHKTQAAGSANLVDAATLAAHFSDARGQGIVEVGYAERRFVRKPKGAAAGMVVCSKERVIALRLEPERLQRLLRTENEPEADKT